MFGIEQKMKSKKGSSQFIKGWGINIIQGYTILFHPEGTRRHISAMQMDEGNRETHHEKENLDNDLLIQSQLRQCTFKHF